MKRWSAAPYILWSALFIIIPLLLVLYFSMVKSVDGVYVFSLENYQKFLEPIYLKVLWRSLKLALLSTFACILLGYPTAMILAKVNLKHRNSLILLFILPMWMNFLLRTYAWMTILGKNGLDMLYTENAVLLGMVYNFLPFMVLPIYTVLIKMDPAIMEAAEDLGASRFRKFSKIIFPLSMPGVVSGITMVFMPAVSTFVISSLLGGSKYALIGDLVEQQFLVVGDWQFGSAISMIMMVMILLSMLILSRFDQHEEGGNNLW